MAQTHSLVTIKMKRRQRKQWMMMGGFTQEILDSGYQYVTRIAYKNSSTSSQGYSSSQNILIYINLQRK